MNPLQLFSFALGVITLFLVSKLVFGRIDLLSAEPYLFHATHAILGLVLAAVIELIVAKLLKSGSEVMEQGKKNLRQLLLNILIWASLMFIIWKSGVEIPRRDRELFFYVAVIYLACSSFVDLFTPVLGRNKK